MSAKSVLVSNSADILTGTRIICAVLLLFQEPFSIAFWILYIYCGTSDVLDGCVAKITNTACERGEIFDSVADVVFIAAILLKILPLLSLPSFIWICVAAIILIRIVSYILGFIKYNTFSALHTYLNKATGALLIILPVLYAAIGSYSIAIICTAAAVSSCEELYITIKSKELNRNCRSIFEVIQ